MRDMMGRATTSQLLGKLNPDAHACRERLPETHTFTGETVGGVQPHVNFKFCIRENETGSAACNNNSISSPAL